MGKRFLSVFLFAALMTGCMLGLSACKKDDAVTTPGGSGAVKEIAVSKAPDKTEYYVGEAFSVEGGMIAVTDEDNKTAEISMTAEGVELTAPDMTKAGNKTITVTYGEARDRFTVSVQNQGFKITFDQNYEGAESTAADITKGSNAERPADPARAGYTFYNWYQDKDCTVPYDFATPVAADTTVYAAWKQDGVTYCEVTYDLNYYGAAFRAYSQLVANGETAKPLSETFTRTDYTFSGWCSDAAGTSAYAPAPITTDTTIYANWTKAKTGTGAYIFEAENTDLTGKTGPGFSGSASERDMIIDSTSASGGKAVSYMYKNGLALEFYIASDSAVSDAAVVLSLAAEMDGISFTSAEFRVLINGDPLAYDDVSLPNDQTFTDAITISGVSLNEGANSIVLEVNNSKRPMGDASTYAATAPMIDCIKVETAAVLSWDANFGLPM